MLIPFHLLPYKIITISVYFLCCSAAVKSFTCPRPIILVCLHFLIFSGTQRLTLLKWLSLVLVFVIIIFINNNYTAAAILWDLIPNTEQGELNTRADIKKVKKEGKETILKHWRRRIPYRTVIIGVISQSKSGTE